MRRFLSLFYLIDLQQGLVKAAALQEHTGEGSRERQGETDWPEQNHRRHRVFPENWFCFLLLKLSL